LQFEFRDTLRSFFSSHSLENNRIELAYLFGSRVTGEEGPLSDYDIAVLYSKTCTAEETYKLTYELAKLLMTDRVDLVVLNLAPIELRYSVIVTGTVIYEVNVLTRVEFEAHTLSRYGDYLPILRRQRNEILEERSDETGIQRYRTALGKTQRLLEEIRSV
jgi:predicted nucleotidyltransferase